MRKITSIWHTIRQIDEQAGTFNPYYNFANHCFDKVARRHRRDLATMMKTCRHLLRRK